MKKHLNMFIRLSIACIMLVVAFTARAQNPTYTSDLRNDEMVSASVYEFDLYLTRTGTTALEMANFQAAIMINPAFVNGGTVTTSIVSSTSDLNIAQMPTSIAYSAALNCIKLAPKAPPRTLISGNSTSSTDGTYISTTGSRVCRIRLSNSVDFANTGIDPIWNFSLQPYRTVISAFVGPSTSKVNTLITLAEAHAKTLDLTVYTEGLYDEGTASLKKVQDADVDYNQFDKFPGLTSDTVTIQLAETTDPYSILYSASGINLNTNGRCRVSVPGTLAGNYYIVVKHRNSVETWSKSAGESFAGNVTAFDMSSSADQAFGSNLKSVSGGKYVLYSGDVTGSTPGIQDGYIDLYDLNAVYNPNVESAAGFRTEDITGDGFVDLSDLNMVYNNNVNSVGMNTPPNPAGKKKNNNQKSN